MKLKRKILALLLVFALVLGAFPVTNINVNAAGSGEITVYVTVINKETIVDDKNGNLMMLVPMTVPEGSLAFDAVKEVHELFHPEGASAYDESSNFFYKFWGEVTYNVGYFVNGNPVNSPATETVSDGDYLDMMIYSDYSSDIYANFATRSYSVAGGDAVNIDLNLTDVFGTAKSTNDANILYSDNGTMPSVDTGKITNADGEATVYFSKAGIYYLMAEKNGEVVNSSIAKVIVTSDDIGVQGIIDDDKSALTFDTFKGSNIDINGVTQKLNLPTQGESGKTAITWSSDKPAVISSTGIVNRPAKSASNETVTLTASFEYGGVTETKDFTIIVLKSDKNDEEIVEEIIKSLPKEYEAVEWAGAKYDVEGDRNIITKLEDLVKEENPSVSVKSSVTLDSAQTAIATDGVITYGDNDITGNVTFTLSLGSTEKTHTIEVTVPKKQATKQDAYNADWLTFDEIKGENTASNNVTQTLLLPEMDPEGYYTELTWSVNTGAPNYNPTDAITISSYPSGGNYIATVNRPGVGEPAITVSLSASIEGGLYWDYDMSPPGPMPTFAGYKGFTITIPALTQAEVNESQAILDEAIQLYSLDDVTVIGSEEKADLNDIKYHIGDIPYNWNYVDHLTGFKESYRAIQVEWTTTNPGFEDGDITTGADVIRTAADQTGKIVLTLSYGGATATKEWDTTIKAWTSAEATRENDVLAEVKNSLAFDDLKGENTNSNAVTKSLEVLDGAVIAGDGTIEFKTTSVYHEKGANITWTSSNENIVKKGYNPDYTDGFLITQPAYDTEVTLTATLDSPMYSGMTGVTPHTKDITFTVAGKYGAKIDPANIIDSVKDNAVSYIKTNDQNTEWFIADLIAIGHTFTVDEKEDFAEDIIAKVKTVKETDLGNIARYIIVLSSLGYDASDISFADGTSVNLPAKLIAGTNANTSYFTLPYVLIALQQDSSYATSEQVNNVKGWLLDQKDGWMGTTFGTDSITAAIWALSPYYGDANVKAVIDDAVDVMKGIQKENGALYTDGAFGGVELGASSTGLGIVALSSIGVDPKSVVHSMSGASLVDGLTSYYDKSTGKIKPTDNSFPTEQGFRGIIANSKFTSGSSYNLYDFSGVAKTAYKEEVSITFDSNGGANVSTQVIEMGTSASEPATDPTRSGYVFDGWYDNSTFTGNTFDFMTNINKNITLIAKWTPIKEIVESEQSKIENLDATDPTNKSAINDAAKNVHDAIIDAGRETVRNDNEVMNILKDTENKFIEANNVNFSVNMAVPSNNVESDHRLSANSVTASGLVLSAFGDGGLPVEGRISLDVTQLESKGETLVIDMIPMIYAPDGTSIRIQNSELQTPIAIRIQLNDSFVGERIQIVHKFTGGGEETLQADVMTASDGSRYVEFTVTQFSTFEISAISATVGGPNTGDDSDILFSFIVIIAALTGMAGIYYKRRIFF